MAIEIVPLTPTSRRRPPRRSGAPDPTSSGRSGTAAADHWTGLDGLRGLAVIAVLLFHQGFGWARGGYLGVSLFFTLSGFLIANVLIREVDGTGRLSLRSFWGRRLRRLAPAALVTLLLVCVFGALAATERERISLRADVWSALANVTNWRFVSAGTSYADLFRVPSPVEHFWSLAIEEQFYLVFPLLASAIAVLVAKARVRRLSFRWTLATVVVVLMGASLAVQLATTSADRIYYGTDTRAFELLAGVLLACVWRPAVVARAGRVVAPVGSALLVLLIWWWATVGFASAWLYDGGFAVVAVIGALVVAAATTSGPIRTVLSARPLIAVGLVSYGLYLYHWPVYLLLDPARTGMTGWPLFAVRIAVTTALALASYYALEMPFRRGAIGRVRAAPLMWGAGMVAVALVVPLAIANGDRGNVLPTSAEVRATTAEAADQAREKAATAGVAPLKVYVIGDSTGTQFAAGLARYGARTGFVEVRSGAIEACPFGKIESFKFWIYTLVDVVVEPACREAPQRWATEVAAYQPDVILAVAGPANVAPFRPTGSPPDTLLKPTDVPGRNLIGRGVYEVSRTLHDAAPNAAQIWLTSPHIYRENVENGTMVDPLGPQVPAYTDMYNAILGANGRAHPWATTAAWGERFDAAPLSQILEEMPDGAHVPPSIVDHILDEWYPELLRARDAVLTAQLTATPAVAP